MPVKLTAQGLYRRENNEKTMSDTLKNDKREIALPPLMAILNGKYTYICTYEDHRDPKSHKSTRLSTTVGKIVGGGAEGEITWYPEFMKAHPELREVRSFRKIRDSRQGRNSYIIEHEVAA